MKPIIKTTFWLASGVVGYILDEWLGAWLGLMIASFLVVFIDKGFDEAVKITQTTLIIFGALCCSTAVCLIVQRLGKIPLPQHIIFIIFFTLAWRFYSLLKIKEVNKNCRCKSNTKCEN